MAPLFFGIDCWKELAKPLYPLKRIGSQVKIFVRLEIPDIMIAVSRKSYLNPRKATFLKLFAMEKCRRAVWTKYVGVWQKA